jgi:hypothetical protein
LSKLSIVFKELSLINYQNYLQVQQSRPLVLNLNMVKIKIIISLGLLKNVVNYVKSLTKQEFWINFQEILTNVVGSNRAQAMCTRYNSMWKSTFVAQISCPRFNGTVLYFYSHPSLQLFLIQHPDSYVVQNTLHTGTGAVVAVSVW